MGFGFNYPQAPDIKGAFYGGLENTRDLTGAQIYFGIQFWEDAETGQAALITLSSRLPHTVWTQ